MNLRKVKTSVFSYASNHSIWQTPKAKLIIRSEHLRLLHTGPTLLSSSLSCKYHTIGRRRSICSIPRSCIICLHQTEKPKPQQMGQLPIESDAVFENVGVDYAGPMYIKYGYVRSPRLLSHTFLCSFHCRLKQYILNWFQI